MKKVFQFLLLCFFFISATAQAQTTVTKNYPERPIKIVVGFVPGGPTDLYARIAAKILSEGFNQQVVVENKPGASGAIAAAAVAAAPGDGYTLLVNVVSDIIAPIANPKVGYNLLRDFSAIGLIASAPNILVIKPELSVNSVAGLVALGKAHPGTLDYGSAGVGTVSHLAAALLEAEANIKLSHIQYKGTNGAQVDLLAGRLAVMFDNMTNGQANAAAGKLKALAVTSAQRWPAAPDLPTMAESGYPGATILSVFGLLAPKGTPSDIVQNIAKILSQGLSSEEYRQAILKSGAAPGDLFGKAYSDYLLDESSRWESFLKANPLVLAN